MQIYETEEQQVDALKRWWKSNGTSAITGVVIGILIISGWNLWTSQQDEKNQKASALYQQLILAMDKNNDASVNKISLRIINQYKTTVYADYATLFRAKANVETGDISQAKTILEQLMLSSSAKDIQHVARIRLVRLMLASQHYEQGLQLIAEIDASRSESYEGSYQELTGDLYAALGRNGEARTAYQKALRLGHQTPLLQFKIDDLTATEIVETEP